MITRRGFIERTAILGAGAAAGIGAVQQVRKSASTELSMSFFNPRDVVVKATLVSDENRDLFEIRVHGDEGSEIVASLPLSTMRGAMDGPWIARLRVEKRPVSETEMLWVKCVAEPENLRIETVAKKPLPVWMPLEDVRKVL